MKTIVQTIFALSFTIFSSVNLCKAQDQHLLIGSRFGIGEGIVHLEGLSSEKSKIALTAGIATNYQFNRFLGVNADFMFVSKGGNNFSYTTERDVFGNDIRYTYKDRFDIYTIDLPLAVKLRLPLSETFALKAFAGPNFQFNLYGSETRVYDDMDYQSENGFSNQRLNELNAMEYGFQYGFGVEVGAVTRQTFFMDFRINESLSNVGVIQGSNANSSNYMISIGYLF